MSDETGTDDGTGNSSLEDALNNMRLIKDIAHIQITRQMECMTCESRVALAPALELALDMLEEISPCAMVLTTEGPKLAYGPKGFGNAKFLVCVATPDGAGVFDAPTWPDMNEETAHQYERSAFWSVLVDFFREQRARDVVICLTYLLGLEGQRRARAIMDSIAAGGMTPFLVVLAASTETNSGGKASGKAGGKAGGMMAIVALPASLETQLSEIAAGEVTDWMDVAKARTAMETTGATAATEATATADVVRDAIRKAKASGWSVKVGHA
jgi:hypothetical protein